MTRDSPCVTLVSAAWVRIQLVFHLRVDPPDAPFDPGLVPAGATDPVVRPVRIDRRDGGLTLHVNVMQGPGLDPLPSGDWILADGGAPIELTPPEARADLLPREFRFPGAVYRATPRLDPTNRLVVHVEIDPLPRAGAARSGPVRRWAPVRLLISARRRVRRRVRPARIQRSALRVVARLVATTTPHRGKRRVVFVSAGRAALAGNLRAVHDRMLARGLDRECRLDVLFRPLPSPRRSLGQWLRMCWLLGRADVVLAAGSRERAIYDVEFGPDVRVVQLWHASGAFKTVGYSRIGKPDGPDPYSRVHKNYTHAIVSSEFDVPFYAEAFGIPESRVFPIGSPRMDPFFDPEHASIAVARAGTALPMIENRRVVLFAPTFRGRGASDAYYPPDRLDLPALHALCEELDAVALIKMHPFVRARIEVPHHLRDRIVDATHAAVTVNDLLFVVDVMVTDYSSILFEFAALGRPMIFYAFDLEQYVAGRDFYVPLPDFVPGPIVRTFPELIEAIRGARTPSAEVRDFAARHFAHQDAGSTDRVIDEVILGR